MPSKRRADADAGHGILGQRHVEVALGAELLVQAERRAEHAARIVDALAHDEDAGIARHLRPRRLEHGLAVGERAVGFSLAKTWS